jgi:hypothetical protein
MIYQHAELTRRVGCVNGTPHGHAARPAPYHPLDNS